MSFYDFYHAFFGDTKGDRNRFSDGTEEKDYLNSARDSVGHAGMNNLHNFSFKIMTDPFEMHYLFQQCMYDFFNATIPDLFPESGDSPDISVIEENVNPRDLYLKPDFSKTPSDDKNVLEHRTPDFNFAKDQFEMHYFSEKKIKDMFNAAFSDLVQVIDDSPNEPSIKENVNPRDHYLKPEFNKSKTKDSLEHKQIGDSSWFDHFFPSHKQQGTWSSSYRKTITFADGTVKTEEVIRNADGTEQRTESTTVLDGNSSSQMLDPNTGSSDIRGQFGMPPTRVPKMDFLKPGYENSYLNAEKVDKDLDKEISLADIEHLPMFSNNSMVLPEAVQGFSKTKRTVISKNGDAKSEEIIKKPDGTEERRETISTFEPSPFGILGLSARKMKELAEILLGK